MRRSQGFTLIELMLVLAIISILTAIAFGVYAGGIPDARLREADTSVQQTLIQARAEAVRKHRYQKVCFFADPLPFDATPLGVVRRYECATDGTAGCPAATICSATADATTAAPVTAANLTCAAGTWCLLSNATVDFSSLYYSRYKTVIWGFDKVQNSSAPNATVLTTLELTYSPTGTLNAGRSSGSYTAGTILVSDLDFCKPSAPPSCTSTKFKTINYALGGTVRMGI